LKKIVSFFIVLFAFSVLSLSCFATITGIQSFANHPSPHCPDFPYSFTDSSVVFMSFKSLGVWYFAYYAPSPGYVDMGIKFIKGDDITHFYTSTTTSYVMDSSRYYIVIKNVNDYDHYWPISFFQLFHYSGSAWIGESTTGSYSSNFPSFFSDFYFDIPTGGTATSSKFPASFTDFWGNPVYYGVVAPDSITILDPPDGWTNPFSDLSVTVEAWLSDWRVVDPTTHILTDVNLNNPLKPLTLIPYNIDFTSNSPIDVMQNIIYEKPFVKEFKNGKFHMIQSFSKLLMDRQIDLNVGVYDLNDTLLCTSTITVMYSGRQLFDNGGVIIPDPRYPPVATNWGKATDYTGQVVGADFFTKGFDFIKVVFGIFPPEINALIIISITGLIILGTWRMVVG
jgi:hypothetical protein